jgi:CsoR family transcriptional regulator, copper-sensing transcriptional repressor
MEGGEREVVDTGGQRGDGCRRPGAARVVALLCRECCGGGAGDEREGGERDGDADRTTDHAPTLAPYVPSDTYEGYLVPAEYPESVIDDIKKRALHRTKIIEGQLRGIEKMIENEDYCVDIITLSLAVQKSLGSLNKLLVENHLRTHVTDMYEAGGGERDAAVAELIRIFELSNNRG